MSEIGFGITRLLGFDLLPRIKRINKVRLYRPAVGEPDAYPGLAPALTRPIRWDLIAEQYDSMIKYATAIRSGTATTEAILRRFTKANAIHPTYQAMLELGRAQKTIFMGRRLALRGERPDYAYLKDVFRHLRAELDIEVTRVPKKLAYVPNEAEIRAFYQAVWKARRASDVVLIKTLLYTGVRVAELVRIRLADIDLDACRIRVTNGKGGKDRVVPFPAAFKETLALHVASQRRAGAAYLFESSWKKPYSDRGVRKILARYITAAGITASISPHKLRRFLFTWLKTQGIDDALIQPYSGHATRQSLEICSRVALADAQQRYDGVIGQFPVRPSHCASPITPRAAPGCGW